VDKRALPFPEPTQLRLAARRPSFDQTALSPTEKMVASVWAKYLHQVPVRTIAPDNSFFDLGGHSLMAQYVLLDIQKQLAGTTVSISALFQKPTLRAFAEELDRLQDPIGLNIETADEGEVPKQSEYYSDDLKTLLNNLPKSFTKYQHSQDPVTVLLTGATGFLGAHILDLLTQSTAPIKKVVVHVRSKDVPSAVQRVQNTMLAYGLPYDVRIACVTGDLAQPQLGIEEKEWESLVEVR
jgi:L-aminoadipate-semialdehyde dehydrogenase